MNNQIKMNKQAGQAMTEFVVSVSYVFLGLFVIVPTFGKIMDMQFQTQQASRYVAWERTVWFDQGEEPGASVQSNDYWESVAIRDDDDVLSSMENRFFYGSGSSVIKPVTVDDIDAVTADASPIWTYVQSDKTMYGGTTLTESLGREGTPGIAYEVIDTVNSVLTTVASPLNEFMSAVGGTNDDFLTLAYERENYYKPVITTQVNSTNSHGGGTGEWDRQADGSMGTGIEDAIFQNWDGKFKVSSAILADGWNTQSLDHYQERADDFVPSTLFKNSLFDAVIFVAGILDPAIGDIEFGAVGIEPMPAEDGEPLDVDCDDGFCYYDE